MSLPLGGGAGLGAVRRLADVYEYEKKHENAQIWGEHMRRVFDGTDRIVQISPLTALGFQAFAAPVPNTLARSRFVPPI